MLENIRLILSIFIIVLTLISTLSTFIAKNSKNAKRRKAAENFNKVAVVVKKYVQDAEDFVNYKGSDKKEWVKTKVNQFAIENKIPYNEVIVDDLIEDFVALTKRVNKREKDKEVLD